MIGREVMALIIFGLALSMLIVMLSAKIFMRVADINKGAEPPKIPEKTS
jgi:hypothetical protein